MLKVIKRNKKHRWSESKYSEPHKERLWRKEFKDLLIDSALLAVNHISKEKSFFPAVMENMKNNSSQLTEFTAVCQGHKVNK